MTNQYNIDRIDTADRDKIPLIVTENQSILDYYNYKHESIKRLPNGLALKSRMKHLMKENVNGAKIKEKKLIALVFTDPSFEGVVDELYRRLSRKARVYRVFLKDISYERLISIDHIDCIVLVDCPVFQCDMPIHIPIVSPFSAVCGLCDEWRGEYDRNYTGEGDADDVIPSDETSIVALGRAAELMECREFKGVLYGAEDDGDMSIHVGRTGIASKYDSEGN